MGKMTLSVSGKLTGVPLVANAKHGISERFMTNVYAAAIPTGPYGIATRNPILMTGTNIRLQINICRVRPNDS
jgi:hypothetical protein